MRSACAWKQSGERGDNSIVVLYKGHRHWACAFSLLGCTNYRLQLVKKILSVLVGLKPGTMRSSPHIACTKTRKVSIS